MRTRSFDARIWVTSRRATRARRASGFSCSTANLTESLTAYCTLTRTAADSELAYYLWTFCLQEREMFDIPDSPRGRPEALRDRRFRMRVVLAAQSGLGESAVFQHVRSMILAMADVRRHRAPERRRLSAPIVGLPPPDLERHTQWNLK